MTRDEILEAIWAERGRQSAKWSHDHGWGHGDASSPDVAEPVKVAVLAEECGEVARAVLDRNRSQLRRELIQVAAVAVAWLEALPWSYPSCRAEEG